MNLEISDSFLEPKCPRCGGEVQMHASGFEPSPDDKVVCPVHGLVGSRDEVLKKIVGDIKEKVGERLEAQLRKIWFRIPGS
jgi:hypothetical protein